MKKILILGCGPAGLFAAHAASQAGHAVSIISKLRKSEMFGAQYLHRDIFGLTVPTSRTISYELRGTPEGYRRKVYGDRFLGEVSPEALDHDHQAWDIRAAYDRAWTLYSGFVNELFVHDGRDLQRGLEVLSPDEVISTIPLPSICLDRENHYFKFEEVYASGDAPSRGISCPVRVEPNTVICDGTSDVGYYRAANVFDHCSVEWPGGGRKPPFENVSLITKPLSTTCTCWPNVLKVGRYGSWTKGVLSHEAYAKTAELLA